MEQILALLEGRVNTPRHTPYNMIGQEETDAALRVMQSRNLSGFVGRAGDWFLGGPEVKAMEKGFCETFKVKHAVSFNSASTALQAAVAALGIGPGDEVITSPYTMAASATAILLNNAVPVFADIDERSFCLDPESVRKLVTPRTKAIMAVNIFGGSAEYDALKAIAKEFNLRIIEDNAQAPAGMYRGEFTGTIGDIGVYSLNVHKVIQCGEGGVLVTNDDQFAFRAQLVRNHGEVVVDDMNRLSPEDSVAGSNYRLSEIHAAIAGAQLAKLDGFNATRIALANRLTKGLEAFDWIVPCFVPEHMKHVYYLYPFRILSERIGISRATFVKAMDAEGFRFGVGYVKPIYLMPMYQQKRMFPHSQFPFVSAEYPSEVSYARGICPVTERMFDHELLTTTLCQPQQSEADIDAFIDAVRRIGEAKDALKQYEEQNANTVRRT